MYYYSFYKSTSTVGQMEWCDKGFYRLKLGREKEDVEISTSKLIEHNGLKLSLQMK